MLCPLAGYSIDENGARITAAITMAMACAVPFLSPIHQLLVLALLVLDFAMRAFSRPRYSPLANLARKILWLASVPPHKVDAGPKRFAARIGLGMLLVAALCSAQGMQMPVLLLSMVLALCAALEATISFCVGCWIWSRYWQLRHGSSLRAG